MTVQGLHSSDSVRNATAQSMLKKATASNEQIISESISYASEKAERSPLKKARKAVFPTAVVALAGIAAAKKGGTASAKLLSGAACVGAMALASGTMDAYTKATTKAIKSSEQLQEKTKKHPTAAAVGLIGGILAVGLGTLTLAAKGPKIAEKLLPNLTSKVKGGWGKLADKIDKSAPGKAAEGLKKIGSNFAKKHPNIAGLVSRNIEGGVIIGSLAASIGLSNKQKQNFTKDAASKAGELMTARQEAQEALFEAKVS
ncbi:hypothetical protein tpqmel_0068 [Candidatus Gastranaerophilus sp. (ex Termes propinquus)]|nr:hypothetical protein tpqmel_0068 [Candidatus Gastranaerophilus sp. (ex Termes propinquus)]